MKSNTLISLAIAGMAAGGALSAQSARADISTVSLSRAVLNQQTGPGTVVPGSPFTSFSDVFSATMIATGFDGASLSFPGPSSPISLNQYAPIFFATSQVNSPSTFPSGAYTFTATNSATNASKSVTVNYIADLISSTTPQLDAQSYNALQDLNPSQPLTLGFNSFSPDPRDNNSFAPGSTNIQFIDETTSVLGLSTTLSPTATNFTVPVNALSSGDSYLLEIGFNNYLYTVDHSIGRVYMSQDDVQTYVAFTVPAVGASASNPILPGPPSGNSYRFSGLTSGSWYDPAAAQAFQYSLSGGDFTEVGAPPASFGFGPLDVVVGGKVVDVLDPGDTYLFGPGVSEFRLEGISPSVDATDPAAFPTYLAFSGNPTGLAMTPLASVPESASWALMILGFGGLGALARSRRRAGPAAAASSTGSKPA